MTPAAKSNFITHVRQNATDWRAAIEELQNLKSQWDLLVNAELTDEDFVGENAGLTKTDIANVIGTTLSAEVTLQGAGHGTNLEKVRL